MNDAIQLSPERSNVVTTATSLVDKIATEQPDWIRELIVATLEPGFSRLSQPQVCSLIEYLSPVEQPLHSKEVVWASRKIMQARYDKFVESTISDKDDGDLKLELPTLKLAAPIPIGKLGPQAHLSPRKSGRVRGRRRRGRRSIIRRLLSPSRR